jgi:uncharacterized protein (TIGR03435 family)
MVRALAVAGAVFGACCALGQTSQPQFEAVSIKPDKSGESRETLYPAPGGRFTATNVTAKRLIEWAYGMREFQISGEPAWADSERFDVVAKADGNPRYDFLQPTLETMFRAVLADRFRLSVRTVTKELPVYFLVVVKNGPKIHVVGEDGCPQAPDPQNPCRSLRSKAFAQLSAQRASMAALARMLINIVGRSVIDDTGSQVSHSGAVCSNVALPVAMPSR